MITLRIAGTWEVRDHLGGRWVSETTDADRGDAASSSELAHIDELLYMARNLNRIYEQVEDVAFGVDLKADEHPLLFLQSSGVVELRVGGKKPKARSQAKEFRTVNTSSYPVRTHHDLFVSEPYLRKIIESDGATLITTRRVLYSSLNWSRSWEYAKATEIFHSDAVGEGWRASYIGVSNRARTSGFIYRSGFARTVRDRLVLALAVADGTLEDMVLALKAERSELERS
jgi:hypothetical protein